MRDKVGATHRPLPGLLHAFLDAGLPLERFAEGGAPTPMVLAIRARKPRMTPCVTDDPKPRLRLASQGELVDLPAGRQRE